MAGIDVKAYCVSRAMSVAREMFSQKAIGSTSDVTTWKRVGRFVCPRLERESLSQTNMRTGPHWVNTQASQYTCDRQTRPDELGSVAFS